MLSSDTKCYANGLLIVFTVIKIIKDLLGRKGILGIIYKLFKAIKVRFP